MTEPLSPTGRLRAEVTALLDRACTHAAGSPAEADLHAIRSRLEGPLRVALAGKVKAGKSTLLNALVGERLAATDVGECTKIVTWYEHGLTYRVRLEPHAGEDVAVPFRRVDGALAIELHGYDPEDVARLRVAWPSAALTDLTLIDTPGIGSLQAADAQRSWDFLTPQERAADADAVCYLMRHLHGADVRFLESFHDNDAASPTPVNAIGVLSRADEIGVARPDALDTAARIAQRYEQDPNIRRLCQSVVPVAGLLAETAATLRQDEFTALAALTCAPVADTDAQLLSVDRFVDGDEVAGLTVATRERLLQRLGIFGVRLGLTLIRQGRVSDAPGLAATLLAHSGITELRARLTTQFRERADLLRARSALAGLDATLASHPNIAGQQALRGDLERIRASTHAFTEARLLNLTRAGNLPFDDDTTAEADRLLGGNGHEASARLGLPPTSDHATLQEAALTAAGRWQRRAEHPLAEPDTATAARQILRSCEELVSQLAARP